ncbi:hypothetical protein BGZ96_004214 [Linnemannia gamsii]|uniref:F-box domain-containing protein n=1 Tax=Linnemannia gamsii TaxID=64522 RepID=A0ABQ7KHW4_9FUNG|nr:hypothetical protein BGZ96_004214 [Linnemannia gamsii]
MAAHWTPQDLYACVQVCRIWHQTLTPFLWHTIDDRLYAWPRLLATHDTFTLNCPGFKGYFRILSAFTRYGHHIRHLRLSWRALIDIVFVAGSCTQLQSLSTFNLAVNRTTKEREEIRRLANLSIDNGGLTYDEHRNLAVEGPLLSPEFAGVFSPSEIEWRSVQEQQRDWVTAQNFWSLVLENRQTLRSLRLDRSLDSLAHLESTTNDFFFSTLASLPHLTELDNALLETDLRDVLERLPNLRCNRSSNLELHNQVLPKAYDHLRALQIYNSVPSRTFFSLLARLPNLEDLRISEFVRREHFIDNPQTILNNTPTRLKGLHIMSGAGHHGRRIAQHIIPWVPLLTSFTIDRLYDVIAEALFTHCKHLENIRQSDDGCTLFEIQYGENQPLGALTSKLFKLLRDYPSLRVLDRIEQRLVAADLVAQDWLPLNNLEVFRCQIVDVDRLTPSEEETVVQSSSWFYSITQNSTLSSKHTQSITLQKDILSRLGTLTNLRVLDLGYEWRDIWADSRRDTVRRYTYLGQEYVNYGAPFKNTLELTLATGLDQLSRLRHLEVFGFEGVDHRIGKEELEWIAVHWPKLKVMRGLQEDDHLEKIEPDPVKTELRLHMEWLRPDVKHESLSRQGSRKV